MKKLSLFLIAVMAFVLSSCGGASSPEQVATDFYKAYCAADFEKAGNYSTESTKQLLTFVTAMMEAADLDQMKASKPEITVDETTVSEDGNTATVKLSITGMYDYTNHELSKEAVKEDCNLVKENGKWKVNMSK